MQPKLRLTLLSAVAFFLSSSVLFFIPVFPRETNRIAATALAIAFWVFFASGVYLTFVLAKDFPSEDPTLRGVKRLFRFFSGRLLIVADTAFFTALLAGILTAAFSLPTGWLGYIIIFLILYCAELHCILVITTTNRC